METLSVIQAKLEFDNILQKAQQRPIGINKDDEPVAVIISTKEYAQFDVFKEE